MDIKRFARERNGEKREDLEKTVEELGRKSEGELTEQLMREVARGKCDGSLTADALAEFTEKVAPMLSAEQQKRMEELIRQLKL